MRALVFTFTWPDGASATAELVARAPELDTQVKYTGAVDRLPATVPATCPAYWAEADMDAIARQVGAQVGLAASGDYDVWAK